MSEHELYIEPVSESSTVDFKWDDNTYTWPSTSNISNFSYTWPNTVYKYQLICPECKTTNWAELDTLVTCRGKLPNRIKNRKLVEQYCEATLKAVSKRADHEVEVDG